MEALTDAIGLRRHGLGFGVIDVIDRQVKLVIMLINTSEKPGQRTIFSNIP